MKVSDINEIKKQLERMEKKLDRIIQDLMCTCYEAPRRDVNKNEYSYCPRHGFTDKKS